MNPKPSCRQLAVAFRAQYERCSPAARLREAVELSPSWLTSMVAHAIVLLILGLVTLPAHTPSGRPILIDPGRPPEEPLDLLSPIELPPVEPVLETTAAPDVEAADESPLAEDLAAAAGPQLEPALPGLDAFELPDGIFRIGHSGHEGTSLADSRIEGFRRDTTGGRVVAGALDWLAAHQWPDGSWSFDHRPAPACRGRCGDPGRMADARIAATALALLPFLGAGQTHQHGDYRDTVRRGLYYLVAHEKLSPEGGALNEPGGRMYSHGLASIVLCEAYAMTADKGLRGPAQAAVQFTCYAQDPLGGGWRYEPRQPGDTSVVGWQLMALKSGRMAYLVVPEAAFGKASAYLDGVGYESGSRYGYTDAGHGSSATTAIGLLCRMYLGWKKDNPALERGAEWLSRQGPSPSDMYYNYYATMVLRQWEGPLWIKWRNALWRQLAESQATEGHEAGSWYMAHPHAEHGGRLYCTATAAMVLEVYYRMLPLYREGFDDFVE